MQNSCRRPSGPSLLAPIRDATWLDGQRIHGYAVILLCLEIVVTLFMIAGQHGLIVPVSGTIFTDFAAFYGAGVLAGGVAPGDVYSDAAIQAAQAAIYSDPSIRYNIFFYPPVVLLMCRALATLPYLVAFYVWITAQGILYLAALRAMAGRGIPLLSCVAFPAVFYSCGMGQNALLTASIFAAGTAALGRGRPFLAGLILGCLIYKPHFGLLLPVAFLAGREWRATAGAACSVVALCLASALVFGWGVWDAYIHLFLGSASASYGDGGGGGVSVDPAGYVSVFGAVLLLGGSKLSAIVVQSIASIGAAAVVALVWRRTRATAPRAIALLGGTLFAIPVVLYYGLMPAVVAMLWMAVDSRSRGWTPWDKAGMVLIFAVAALARPMAQGFGIPVGPAVGLILLAAALRRFVPPQAPVGAS